MTPQLISLLDNPDLVIATVPGCIRARTAEEGQPLRDDYIFLCPECNGNYLPAQVGIKVVEVIESDKDFRPYRVWSADRLACNCGRHSVRMGRRPICGEWDAAEFKPAVAHALGDWLREPESVVFWSDGKHYRDDAEIYTRCVAWLLDQKNDPDKLKNMTEVVLAIQAFKPVPRGPDFSQS